MLENGLLCDSHVPDWAGENRCNSYESWQRKRICQHSCFLAGHGYSGDICCESPPPSAPSPPVFPAPPSSPPAHPFVDLIIDTDMSIDVDDVGMLCTAHALVDLGEARILAVLHDAALDSGVGAISAINHYYSRDHIPIGAYFGSIGAHSKGMPTWTNYGRGVYADDLVRTFNPPIRDTSQVPDATKVYRQTLAEAEDGSVTIVSVGFVTNLLSLLQSKGDTISPLRGHGLVSRKVKRLVQMGGTAVGTSRVEWNFGACGGDVPNCGSYSELGAATAQLFSLWPRTVPIVFVPYETGERVLTGWLLKERNLPGSPCDRAYKLFCEDKNFVGGWCQGWPQGGGRQSWDPMAILYAVRGDPGHNYVVEQGHNRVLSPSGGNRWKANSNIARHTNQSMLLLNDADTARRKNIMRELDELYMQLPRSSGPFRDRPPSSPPANPLSEHADIPFNTSVVLNALVRNPSNDTMLPAWARIASDSVNSSSNPIWFRANARVCASGVFCAPLVAVGATMLLLCLICMCCFSRRMAHKRYALLSLMLPFQHIRRTPITSDDYDWRTQFEGTPKEQMAHGTAHGTESDSVDAHPQMVQQTAHALDIDRISRQSSSDVSLG